MPDIHPPIAAPSITLEEIKIHTRAASTGMLRALTVAPGAVIDPAMISLHIGDAISALRLLKIKADAQATLNRARYDRGNAVK